MTETLLVWKATRKNAQPIHGSKPLPPPGEWLDTGGPPALCRRGVHGCRTLKQMISGEWLNEELWVAELRGPFVEEYGVKIAAQRGRLLRKLDTWNDCTARLFAADCAERALLAADDPSERSVAAVLAARRFAFALIDDEARSAAQSAAWHASRSAAESVAEPAALSAALSAAQFSAWCAARSAAWHASHSAAESAESSWQAVRLNEYLTGAVDLEAIRKSVAL